jgi:hypothetical protein
MPSRPVQTASASLFADCVQTIETAVSRYKTIIGRGLRARSLPAQRGEARVGCSVLNRMTRLGMPVSRRVA